MKLFKSIFLLIFYSCFSLHSQVIINEIMATNASSLIETDYYNFPDWIEIYNSSSATVSLSDFYLSDDLENLKKWKFPNQSINSNAYFLVYCDKKDIGNHTNFGLDADGETVYLSNSSGLIIDDFEYPAQYPNISSGRNPSSIKQILYCSTPTPGEANITTSNTKQASKPKFSLPAGRLGASAEVSISGENVKYTTNGAEPDESSDNYDTPININRTLIIKAKSYADGHLAGEPAANTYFINEHEFTLPVVSISFTPNYFYDNMIGIHVPGTNGIEGRCKGTNYNWNQPWERAAYLEYFDTNGKKQISQPIGVKISGGCTRAREQKSLSLYARSKYGDKDFDYTVFAQKPHIDAYKSLLLRNSGNDQDQTLLRDAYIQALVNNSMDIDFQSYQPTTVYFNGEYRGIMNLREKLDEDYFITNYNLGSDEIDFLEGVLWADFDNAYNAIRGSMEGYWEIVNFLTGNDLNDTGNYEWVVSQLDLQEYINYMTTQIYIANRDWPGNNLKFWRAKENGKWRWILFDTDYGYGFRLDENGYQHKTFEYVTDPNELDHPNPGWSTLLFRKLIVNEEFKSQFLRTFLTHVHTSFHPDWGYRVLDSLSGIIDSEISYNQSKYGRTKSKWEGYLNTIKKSSSNRYSFMPEYVKEYFNISSEKIEIHVPDFGKEKGKVIINSATVQHYPFTVKTYSEFPVSLEAVPETGFTFSHWINHDTANHLPEIIYSHSIETDTGFSMSVEPVFEPIDYIGNIYLNEIAALSSEFKDEYEENSGFIEIYNTGIQDAVLKGFFLSDNKNHLTKYAIPDSTVIPANGFLLFYTDGETKQGELHTPFKVDNNGETVILSQKVGAELTILDSISFSYLAKKHSFGKYKDGTGEWLHMEYMTPLGANNPKEYINSIIDFELSDNINIYPNPTNGIVHIELDNLDFYQHQYSFDIINIQGQLVYPLVWLNRSNNIIPLTMLDKGIYLIRIKVDNLYYCVKKIIVE